MLHDVHYDECRRKADAAYNRDIKRYTRLTKVRHTITVYQYSPVLCYCLLDELISSKQMLAARRWQRGSAIRTADICE